MHPSLKHTKIESKKREGEERVFPQSCERVSDVFSPSNRDISVVLLLEERGCNSHIT
jgi:hypothetical protein